MLKSIRESLKNTLHWLKERFALVSRAQWNRAGYYAALALLLVILGAASSAYRHRAAQPPVEEPAVKSALSAQAESTLPEPEPTEAPNPWAWPLEGEIIGEYATDEPVWSATLELWQTHPALDIAGSPGEAVCACRDGVVADAWSDRLWGNVIVIDHGSGWRSVYRGLNTLNLVEVGSEVHMGDVISAVAQSVSCEADLPAHIHFELTKDGNSVDFARVVKGGEGENRG